MTTVDLSEAQRQKIMADWKEIAKPILVGLGMNFRRGIKVSEVVDEGDVCDKYGEKFSFHIGNPKNKMVEIYLELVSSLEFEGEFLGWNVQLSAIGLGGKLGPQYAPCNYTSECWTCSWETIKYRTEQIKNFANLFTEEVLEFRKGI